MRNTKIVSQNGVGHLSQQNLSGKRKIGTGSGVCLKNQPATVNVLIKLNLKMCLILRESN